MGAELITATLPFTKKRIGAHYKCSKELNILLNWCAENYAELFLTYVPYQVAKIIGPDYRIVVYPHKTTAGHHHLRLRNEGSKNINRAEDVMRTLDNLEEVMGCTFSRRRT